jgi:hypothetical protein
MHPPRANARVRRCRSPICTYPFHLDARRILVWLAIISDLLLIDYQLLWDISKQEAKIQSYFVFVLEIIGQTARFNGCYLTPLAIKLSVICRVYLG